MTQNHQWRRVYEKTIIWYHANHRNMTTTNPLTRMCGYLNLLSFSFENQIEMEEPCRLIFLPTYPYSMTVFPNLL